MRNLQEEHVKKAFCYQRLFWPFTVWINCSSDLKNFANSWPSVFNFNSFSWSLEQFFLTVGQNNFGNKIQFFALVWTLQAWKSTKSSNGAVLMMTYNFQKDCSPSSSAKCKRNIKRFHAQLIRSLILCLHMYLSSNKLLQTLSIKG